jgi:hypothetical protein
MAFDDYRNYWKMNFGISGFMFLACLQFIIRGRFPLPVVFNRRTGKVSFVLWRKTFSADWKHVEGYAKDLTIVSTSGGMANEGTLKLVFPDADGKSVTIYGTSDPMAAAVAKRQIYGAIMVWEFIRRYMKDGEGDLMQYVKPSEKYRFKHIGECFSENGIVDFKKKAVWWTWIFAMPFIPIILAFDFIMFWTDLGYFIIDHILPRRKWPKELIEACDGVWDGKGG